MPIPRTLYGTDLPTDVTWINISWSAGKDEYGNDIWVEGESNGYGYPAECRNPVPPPAEVCVLKTGNGSATVDYRGVRRTLHFPSSVKLPEGCVSAADAKAWADKHGIRWPA